MNKYYTTRLVKNLILYTGLISSGITARNSSSIDPSLIILKIVCYSF